MATRYHLMRDGSNFIAKLNSPVYDGTGCGTHRWFTGGIGGTWVDTPYCNFPGFGYRANTSQLTGNGSAVFYTSGKNAAEHIGGTIYAWSFIEKTYYNFSLSAPNCTITGTARGEHLAGTGISVTITPNAGYSIETIIGIAAEPPAIPGASFTINFALNSDVSIFVTATKSDIVVGTAKYNTGGYFGTGSAVAYYVNQSGATVASSTVRTDVDSIKTATLATPLKSTVYFEAVADANCTFVGWSTSPEGGNFIDVNPYEYYATTGKTLYAFFGSSNVHVALNVGQDYSINLFNDISAPGTSLTGNVNLPPGALVPDKIYDTPPPAPAPSTWVIGVSSDFPTLSKMLLAQEEGYSPEEKEGYTKIYTVTEFLTFFGNSSNLSKSAMLMIDLDFSDYDFSNSLIAPNTGTGTAFSGTKFTGILDGNGFGIHNVSIEFAPPTSSKYRYYVGLFGYISGGTVRNLNIVNLSITCTGTPARMQYYGGMCGKADADSLFEECSINDVSIDGYKYVGGFIGITNRITIRDCDVTGVIKGNDYVGGFVGSHGVINTGGGIFRCISYTELLPVGSPTSKYKGFCGNRTSSNYTISGCFWNMDISGIDTSDATATGITNSQNENIETFQAESWDISDHIPQPEPYEGDPLPDNFVITTLINADGEKYGFNWSYIVPNEPSVNIQLFGKMSTEIRTTAIAVDPSGANCMVAAIYKASGISINPNLVHGSPFNSYKINVVRLSYTNNDATKIFNEWDVDGISVKTAIVDILPDTAPEVVTLAMKARPSATPVIKITNESSYNAGNKAEVAGNSATMVSAIGLEPVNPGEIYDGDTVRLTPVVVDGWNFVQVIRRSGAFDNIFTLESGKTYAQFTFLANAEYLCLFVQTKVSVTINTDGSGVYSATGTYNGVTATSFVNVGYGDAVVLTAIKELAVGAYSFAGWYNGDICLSTDLSYTIYPTANMVVTAKTLIEVSMVSDNESEGTVTTNLPPGGIVPYGFVLEYETIPEDNFAFFGWKDNNGVYYGDISPSGEMVVGLRYDFIAEFIDEHLLKKKVAGFYNVTLDQHGNIVHETTVDGVVVPTSDFGIIEVIGADEEIDEEEFNVQTSTDAPLGPSSEELSVGNKFFEFKGVSNLNVNVTPASKLGFKDIRILNYYPAFNGNPASWDANPTILTQSPSFNLYKNTSFIAYVVWGEIVKVTVDVKYTTGSNVSMGEISISGTQNETKGDSATTVVSGENVYLFAIPKMGYKFDGWFADADATIPIGTSFKTIVSRTVYAKFSGDVNRVWIFDRSPAKMQGVWESLIYDAGKPVDMNSLRLDADSYPVTVDVKSGESPDLTTLSRESVEIGSQNPRRLPMARLHRYQSVRLTFFGKIRRITTATSMGGLNDTKRKK